jgi:hypothetical protein
VESGKRLLSNNLYRKKNVISVCTRRPPFAASGRRCSSETPLASLSESLEVFSYRIVGCRSSERSVRDGQNVDRNRMLNTEATSLVGSNAGLMIVCKLKVMSVSENNGTR